MAGFVVGSDGGGGLVAAPLDDEEGVRVLPGSAGSLVGGGRFEDLAEGVLDARAAVLAARVSVVELTAVWRGCVVAALEGGLSHRQVADLSGLAVTTVKCQFAGVIRAARARGVL